MNKSDEKKMGKMVKKSIEFGIGAAYLTVEALHAALDTLEKDGKISKKDSERLVKETVKKYEVQGGKYAKKVRHEMDSIAKSTSFATKKEMDELNVKIESISKQLGKRKR